MPRGRSRRRKQQGNPRGGPRSQRLTGPRGRGAQGRIRRIPPGPSPAGRRPSVRSGQMTARKYARGGPTRGKVRRQRGGRGRRRFQQGSHVHEAQHQHLVHPIWGHGQMHGPSQGTWTSGSIQLPPSYGQNWPAPTQRAGIHRHGTMPGPGPVRRQRGGRINYKLRRQMGGPGSILPQPWKNANKK